ncbi:hypothetical protein JOM56_005011 [Amanita muscaria]
MQSGGHRSVMHEVWSSFSMIRGKEYTHTTMTSSTSRRSRLTANWCQHCNQTGHLIMECDAYSSRTARHPRGFTQRYAYDPAGCLSLGYAPNFVRLLSTIRQHLHTSSETQQHYISIAQEFQSKLSSQVLDHQPSLDDFTSFIVDYWPMFRSIAGSLEKVLWGKVSNQPKSPHEVGILSSLVSAAEQANSVPGLLPLPLYNLILTVVILHELSHAFTKHLFGSIITPEGLGPTQLDGYGESGWLLETRLMQGSILASWDHKHDVGRMDMIKRVVLKTSSGSYIIDVSTAEKILQSLGSLHLTPPSSYPLAESPGGDFRARVTKTTYLPKQKVVAPIGLGFCSYVGSDRWDTPLHQEKLCPLVDTQLDLAKYIIAMHLDP